MIKSEIDGVYLITHHCGEVIDGITWEMEVSGVRNFDAQ